MMHSLRKLFSSDHARNYVRRWQRIVMSEPARLLVQKGESRQVMLIQLCAGGVRIATAQRLRPGDMVRLDFKIGVAEQHQMAAMVVYAMKDERGFQWICGLSFVNVAPNGDPDIEEFVEAERRRRQIGFAMPRV